MLSIQLGCGYMEENGQTLSVQMWKAGQDVTRHFF